MEIVYDKQSYLDRVYRKGKKAKSKEGAKSALKKLENYCLETYSRSDDEVINEIKLGRLDVYRFLDSFVGYMVNDGMTTGIKTYMSWVVGYLVYVDVEISEYKLKQKVSIPRAEEHQDAELTHELVSRILDLLSFELSLLCLLILTTLRRPHELCGLRFRDIDFESNPVMITIPASLAKNSVQRETFTTKECASKLLDHKVKKRLGDDDFIFGAWSHEIWGVVTAGHLFRYHLQDYPDLNQKIEGTNRYKIHLYSFKDFGFTRAEKLHSTSYANGLKGDKKSVYSKLPLEEKKAMYLELEPELTISNADAVRKELNTDYANMQKQLNMLLQRDSEREKQIDNLAILLNEFVKGGYEIKGIEKLNDGTIRFNYEEGEAIRSAHEKGLCGCRASKKD